VIGASHPAVQRPQFFLSESRWDHEQVNDRRLALLRENEPAARSVRKRSVALGEQRALQRTRR
jgi:hypothetical protein